MMQIQVRNHCLAKSTELKDHIDRHLQFALGRFAPRIRSITVRLADLNGPRGGLDQECRLLVQLADRVGMRGRPGIVIEELDSDVFSAVARASERAGRAVARHLRLQQQRNSSTASSRVLSLIPDRRERERH